MQYLQFVMHFSQVPFPSSKFLKYSSIHLVHILRSVVQCIQFTSGQFIPHMNNLESNLLPLVQEESHFPAPLSEQPLAQSGSQTTQAPLFILEPALQLKQVLYEIQVSHEKVGLQAAQKPCVYDPYPERHPALAFFAEHPYLAPPASQDRHEVEGGFFG